MMSEDYSRKLSKNMLSSHQPIGGISKVSRKQREKGIARRERYQILMRGLEAKLFESDIRECEQYK